LYTFAMCVLAMALVVGGCPRRTAEEQGPGNATDATANDTDVAETSTADELDNTPNSDTGDAADAEQDDPPPSEEPVDLTENEDTEEDEEVPLSARVPGAWFGTGECNGTRFEFGYLLCPMGRLRGAEKVSDFNFVDCGTWSIDEQGTLTFDYTATDTSIGDEWATTLSGQFVDGEIVMLDGCVVLDRLVGEITEEDCTEGHCAAGGTGDITGCGTDCDCGPCWYCDNGVCRYGGVGPFGCYRGCPWLY
jgi:hypothetical protein